MKISLSGKSRKRITVEVSGYDGHVAIQKILEYFKHCGEVGHSTTVVVDEKGDDEFKTGFDGDGADRIDLIKVEDIGETSKEDTSTAKK